MSKKAKQPPCGDILCEARLEIPDLVEDLGRLAFTLQEGVRHANDSRNFLDRLHSLALDSCDDSRGHIREIEKRLRVIREKITTFKRWSR